MQHHIDTYKKILGLENSKFSEIKHEDAIVAVVYLIENNDGAAFILKVCEQVGHYLREVHFLKQLQGIAPVPRVINAVEPSSEIHSAVLMEYLPGDILQATQINESLAYEIGAYLAQIHLQRINKYGDIVEPGSFSSDPIQDFSFKFNQGFDECKGHLPDSILNRCREYYDKNINLLKNVDGPCVTHRDFRPANIIVDNSKVQGIIDWSSSRYGFAEDDFCPLELGEWAINHSCKREFLSGYASIRPIPNYEVIMPLLRLNRVIATIGFTIRRGTWNNTSANLYKTNLEFLNSFFNLNKE